MRITSSAASAILSVMERKGLDPKRFAFELKFENNILGYAFNPEKVGIKHQFGKLTIVIDPRISGEDVLIDLGEVNGRKGIIFKGDTNANNPK